MTEAMAGALLTGRPKPRPFRDSRLIVPFAKISECYQFRFPTDASKAHFGGQQQPVANSWP